MAYKFKLVATTQSAIIDPAGLTLSPPAGATTLVSCRILGAYSSEDPYLGVAQAGRAAVVDGVRLLECVWS